MYHSVNRKGRRRLGRCPRGARRTFLAIILTAAPLWARVYVVDSRHASASDSAAGSSGAPYKTISRAAALAQPGDSVVVHAGIYRERVAPARGGTSGRPITYMAASGEEGRVFIKGSEEWQPRWRKIDSLDNTWAGELDTAMFGSYNPYHIRMAGMGDIRNYPAGRITLGQVFVNGVYFEERDKISELRKKPLLWMHDSAAGELIIHFPAGSQPSGALVEISVRKQAFAPLLRGLAYITVRGFVIEHAANQFPASFWESKPHAQAGALGTRSGNHWVIEGNIIRHAKNIGIDCGAETNGDLDSQPRPVGVGYHLIRGNVISDNGACGIAAYRSVNTVMEYNIIERNNVMRHGSPEIGGIKCHGFTNGVIRNNLIRGNNCFGVWLDAGWTNAAVYRNLFINNQGHSVYIEVASGPATVHHNIFHTRAAAIVGQDASNVTIAHNLAFKSGAGFFGCTMTGRAGTTFTGWKIVNNMGWGNRFYDASISFEGINSTIACNADSIEIMRGVGDTLDQQIGPFSMDTITMELTFSVEEEFLARQCAPITGVTRDWFGNPLPANPLPGPFQKLAAGVNTFSVALDSLPTIAAGAAVGSVRGRSPVHTAARHRSIVRAAGSLRFGPSTVAAGGIYALYDLQGRTVLRFRSGEANARIPRAPVTGTGLLILRNLGDSRQR